MELKIEKEIDASQEDCYKAFTDPEHLSKWFTTNAKADLKVAGRYSNDDNDEGEFLELKPFERVRFTWDNKQHCPRTEVKIDFIFINEDKTKIILTHSKLESEFHVNDMGKGWRWAFENIKSYLETGKTITFEEWGKNNS